MWNFGVFGKSLWVVFILYTLNYPGIDIIPTSPEYIYIYIVKKTINLEIVLHIKSISPNKAHYLKSIHIYIYIYIYILIYKHARFRIYMYISLAIATTTLSLVFFSSPFLHSSTFFLFTFPLLNIFFLALRSWQEPDETGRSKIFTIFFF